MMIKIPQTFQGYFWDTNLAKIDPKKHRTYLIERLLEYGDEKAYRWLNKNFSKATIRKVVAESRRISPKTRNFWSLIT